MRIAFVHYHLKTGGVTTVIKRQIDAIQKNCQVLTITGETPSAPFPGPVACLSGLGYDRPDTRPPAAEAIADDVFKAIKQHWPQGCDVLHVHNPLLAKNHQFLSILKQLQHKGLNLLLQIHDFAEDGRPAAYFHEAYPQNCHWAVINSRDYRMLQQAGLSAKGLHRIANNINLMPYKASRPSPPPYILYPVRAIRRKNIGEAILLALFLPKGTMMAITLPPHSPGDMLSYSDWQQFVSAHRLRVTFEAGLRQAFPELVGAAHSMVTTSINEGFGFSFLEPWTANKFLWGRNLPDICADFQENNVDLDHLYTRLAIPLNWIDQHQFADQWHTAITEACAMFRHKMPYHRIEDAWNCMTHGDTIDFGLLHEPFQRAIIAQLLENKPRSGELVEHNAFLNRLGRTPRSDNLVANNNAAVIKHYTGQAYGERLLEIYRRVIEVPVQHHINKAHLLDQFFDLEKFSLLKWKPYD